MNENRTDRVENEQRPAITHSSRPPPKKPPGEQGEHRRNERAGQIDCVRRQRPQQYRQSENQVIEQRGCVRRRASWKIFEIVMTDDQSRMFGTHPDACHARVTISVSEINISTQEDFLIIRAPRCQNQHGEERNFKKQDRAAPHAAVLI